MRNNDIKPPLGVTPTFIWIEQRLDILEKAIDKRLYTACDIPIEWIEERNILIELWDKFRKYGG